MINHPYPQYIYTIISNDYPHFLPTFLYIIDYLKLHKNTCNQNLWLFKYRSI